MNRQVRLLILSLVAAVVVAPACAPRTRASTASSTAPGSATTTSSSVPPVEPSTVRTVAVLGDALLDVESGAGDDYFYTTVNTAGVVHVRSDGTEERVGADLWRERLNAFIGYRHIAVATDGTLYVSDTTSLRIWKVEPSVEPGGERSYTTNAPTVVAGRGKSCFDTVFEFYPVNSGEYTAIEGGGCNKYTTWLMDNPDYGISLRTGAPDDGPLASGALLTPWGIDVNADETKLAIAEVKAGKGPGVRVVDLVAGTISTEAAWVPNGNASCTHPSLAEGRAAVGGQDYWGTFNMPFCDVFDVSFAPDGGIVFSAGIYYQGTIEGGLLTVVDDAEGQTLHVLAGCEGASCSSGAGQPGTSTLVGAMSGVDVRWDGTVLYADTNQHRIRKILPDGTVADVVGTGVKCGDAGTCGDTATGLPALSADLGSPRDVAVQSSGALLMAEEGTLANLGIGIGWRWVMRRVE